MSFELSLTLVDGTLHLIEVDPDITPNAIRSMLTDQLQQDASDIRLLWISNGNLGLSDGDKTFAEYGIGGNAQIQPAPPTKRKHGKPRASSRNKCRKLRKAQYLLRKNQLPAEEEEREEGEEQKDNKLKT